jgi:glycosyltransferase involved in cell wall biosynthesis
VITILMPTYNRATLLQRAILSFSAQTESSFRLRVFDNASDDGTREVVRALAARDARIEYFRHEHNIGAIANFRFAMEQVDTEYFAFASDDDVALPRFLEVSLDGFSRYPNAMLSATGTLEMTPEGTLLLAPLATWPTDGYFEAGASLPHMLGGTHPSWNTIVWRREAIAAEGYFDDRLGLVMDLAYTLRVAARHPIVVSREPTGIFIRHWLSAGEHARADIARYYDRAIKYIIGDGDLAPALSQTIEKRMRQMLRTRLVQAAILHLSRGDVSQARSCLNEYVARRSPASPLYVAAEALCRVPSGLLRVMPIQRAIRLRGKLVGLEGEQRLKRYGFDLRTARAALQ